MPAGSRKLEPNHRADQGISASERQHAERAIKRLFEAPGVDMVAFYDPATNEYELRSRTGVLRWERWATPEGELRFRVTQQTGQNPVPSVDGTILRTLEEEAAAAGGVGRPVPKERNSYPDILDRMSQLFDNERAPDFVYIPTPGADPNHPGAGSHGIPDVVQSRSPLIIAGPGIARGAVSDLLVRHEDVAPTIAELLGVRPVVGTNASGVKRAQLMKWQDGRSVAPAVADARAGNSLYGSAQRAIMFVVDGLSQTVMLDELRKGNVPNIARLMGSGTIFRNGSLAEYPTVTWANHNTLVTGSSPGHSGIVNNSWFNRRTQREQLITDGSFRNSLQTGKLISNSVETLYEAVERSFEGARTIAINQPSGRGADISVLDLKGVPSLLGNALNIARHAIGGWGLIDKERAKLDPKDYRRESIKDTLATALGQTYWSKKDPPKLGVFEYTIVDNQGHLDGPHAHDSRAAIRQVDRQIGRVLDTLHRRGIEKSTAIVLTADHGMEHQDRDTSKLGGWFEALDRAAADGAKTKESTRFVYVKSVRFSVDGAVPAAGTRGDLSIAVVNDDEDEQGERPAIAGATVTVSDAAGHSWVAVTDASGRVKLPIAPTAGPLQVVVQHIDFSREQGTIPLPMAASRRATGPAAGPIRS